MTAAAAPMGGHATALVIREAGVLIEGASGSGKSALALACIAAAQAQGFFARLVSDDRVLLAARGGRVIASVHPAIAGQVERRGLAIEPADFCGQAVLRLVARLAGDADADAAALRLPWQDASLTQICGILLPVLPLDPSRARPDQVALVLAALKTATLAV